MSRASTVASPQPQVQATVRLKVTLTYTKFLGETDAYRGHGMLAARRARRRSRTCSRTIFIATLCDRAPLRLRANQSNHSGLFLGPVLGRRRVGSRVSSAQIPTKRSLETDATAVSPDTETECGDHIVGGFPSSYLNGALEVTFPPGALTPGKTYAFSASVSKEPLFLTSSARESPGRAR